eukprot:CAMPEP_0119433364 /NCGR_PEP_ID=MMETSP1335-20130426/49485_1 /TAXON_ID=259385 /ORGANISM="Chrysoculter rhomboideus, Strain RCC1486" /LENGTH=79 /DNA_ID=CAMNT_0007459199 /DNA_START=128 /DNA_END=363 /DNA_ORIENTATION=+
MAHRHLVGQLLRDLSAWGGAPARQAHPDCAGSPVRARDRPEVGVDALVRAPHALVAVERAHHARPRAHAPLGAGGEGRP